MIYFLVHLNRVEEAFLEMEKFLQLVQQCNDAEIMQQKSLIIETNLLILRMYTEVSESSKLVLSDKPSGAARTTAKLASGEVCTPYCF